MSYQFKTTTPMKKKSHIETVRESFMKEFLKNKKEFLKNKYERELMEAELKQNTIRYLMLSGGHIIPIGLS